MSFFPPLSFKAIFRSPRYLLYYIQETDTSFVLLMMGKGNKIGGQRVLCSIHILRNPYLECSCHLLFLISRLLDISMCSYTCTEYVVITKVSEARQTNCLSDGLPGKSFSFSFFGHCSPYNAISATLQKEVDYEA